VTVGFASVFAALVVACLAGPLSSAHASPDLEYGCSPPTPATPDNCDGWHTQPVTLTWDWDALTAEPVAGDCTQQKFSQDTDSLVVSCTVQDTSDMSQTTKTVPLKIDMTPPTVIAATPGRPADSGGFYNHPVGYTIAGKDAMSGLAFCTPVLFGGPGTVLTGSCQDKAGNVGSATFAVPYDATAPAAPHVQAKPGNRSESLSWQPSWDTVRSQVNRSPGPGAAASGAVYSGSGDGFKDSSVANGVTYEYTVTAFDQAGNSSSTTITTTPDASLGLTPVRGAKLGPKRLLRWRAEPNATYYNVQLFHGKRKVLSAWPSKTHLKLSRVWAYRGRMYRLRPGRYRWYLWPGYGSLKKHQYGALIGQSSFVVPKPG
jgi:hypothetical protein